MVFSCFGRTRLLSSPKDSIHCSLLSEKNCDSKYEDYSDSHLAEKMVFTLHTRSMSTGELRVALEGAIRETSWAESIARRILGLLETALAAEASMGPAMKEAFNKAMESAKNITELGEELVKEHPIIAGIVCAILALGILYLLAPAVIELLGFTELGPAPGSFASRWHSLYGARVPIGSVFSYMQRLGMKWNGGVGLVARL
ncbi:uncharacterized protein MYCGRDRAFT_105798 [Zymoseptoria tritici IPO323]|uniref:Uncharacterized protein n=1 Tax=Zymoseptoria tritici (strain CBS 115943 / IPO323) TaxID=336722 RepID=F9XKC2_ZYMTI|nr:uncharacterized protein MYCGRDRAFT_105798 [Zymoseptoria tritici IPO323]EGP84567.1 hypothetical protein MYCGRDRAFT_105798 [Zymoseptoria tritici IPO323]